MAAILDQLGSYKALFAAVQVNKLWADEATTILWRDDPPIQHYSDIKRVQYYANKIRRLYQHSYHRRWSHSQKLRYPRLSDLSIYIDGDEGGQFVLHYLRPSIRRIECLGGRITDKFLMQIEARCPALRTFELRSGQKETIKYDLLRFLRAMPSLTESCLSGGLEDVELCIHLASRPNVQKLTMSSETSLPDQTAETLANITKPFPNLECISWVSQARASHSIAPQLVGLKDPKLTLVDTSDDFLFAITSCINLATVILFLKTDSWVPGEGLLAIAKKCPHLYSFGLYSYNDFDDKLDGRSITDDVIRQVAIYLPGMRHFHIRCVETDLTFKALHLGDQCTELEACSLRGIFDLERLWRPDVAPLFNRLKSLKLLCIPNNISRDRAIAIFDQLAPHVEFGWGYSTYTDPEHGSCEIY